MLADDHALIDLGARRDEQLATLFQVPQRIRHRFAVAGRDQHAFAAAFERAFVGRIAVEHAVDDAGAARVGEEFAVIADEAARRCEEHKARLARAGRAHVLQFAFAQRNLFDDDARIGIVHVDGDFFDRLQTLAILAGLENHARTRDRKLEAFAAHLLDENAELEFAAAGHFISAFAGLMHLDGDIAFGFAQQAVADDAALHLVALAARERGIVHRQRDRQSRRIDRDRRDGLLDIHIA